MAIADTGRWWIWDYLFSRFAWYRRRCGGHWERWFNGLTGTLVWFQTDGCNKATGYRPPCCFGRSACEDYRPTAAEVAAAPHAREWLS